MNALLRTMQLVACCLCLAPAYAWSAAREIRITDDAGAVVRLGAPAQRIIPLYAALGEIVTALGLEDRIVARTAADSGLSAALPSIGTHMRPNLELVAALAPDLVLQMEGREEAALAAQALGRLGIPTARFRVATFEELFSCMERLGQLTGSEEAAARLITLHADRLSRLSREQALRTDRPRIFFEVRYPNLLGAGNESMVNAIIEAAGGSNVLEGHSGKLVRLTEEALFLLDPDIYLVQSGAMNKNPLHPEKRGRFRALRAVREGRVWMVEEDLFSRPGPGSVQAAEDLAEIIRVWRESPSPDHSPVRNLWP